MMALKSSEAFQTVRVDSYHAAMARAKKAARNKSDYVFRGQRDARWRVQSSFERFSRRTQLLVTKKESSYDGMLNEFRNECFRLGFIRANELADFSSLEAFAQHYGMPTRLVDWSFSPFTALFFAFAGDELVKLDSSQRVSLYILDTKKLETGIVRTMGVKDPDEMKALFSTTNSSAMHSTRVSSYVDRNDRIRKQRGCFYTVPFEYGSMEAYIRRGNFPAATIVKVTMPASQQGDALQELSMMGLTAGELMGDPIGVSTDIKYDRLFR